MTSSIFAKGSVVLHAIATTTALALVANHLPVQQARIQLPMGVQFVLPLGK